MGGLGKTTLAQMIYNDKHIANHFQLRCWICVSDHFVLKTILKSIIESTGGNARDLEDLDPLQRRVQGILSGKKFLLVLDDVWNEDQTKWFQLKSMLTCGGIGSSIIVTTRLELVASMTSTLPILRLKILSEVNCWSLFKHYAFQKNEKYPAMLEEIGKEIVKKCGGVPLAAKALGGLLRFKREENEWIFVRDSSLWNLKDDAILPALRLSYNHLPSHLKQCFCYCSIFPKDYELVKDDLIHLWMANGFFQSDGSRELEDIGNEIFNELLWRSLFQDIQKDNYTNMVSCKMHDLVHDLACSITVNECTIVEVNKEVNALMGITRHLSLHFGVSASSTNIVNSCLSKSQPLLRTFYQTGKGFRGQLIQGLIYSNFKCLRVLDLSHATIDTLHVSIRNLKHLRYLDLSGCCYIRSLSDESICSLRNLQVLKLDDCYSLEGLPENMRKMTNLRHLGIRGCENLRRMPVGMGNLICLRELSMFVVVPESGRGISELHGLDHLRGELEIKGLEHVINSKDSKNPNLMRKKNVSKLILSWSEKNDSSTIEGDEEFASIGEWLQPHSNLKELSINYYNGLTFPSWMSHSCLPNLVVIWIVGLIRCENLPSLGKLPLLESLTIGGMDSLKCIGDEFYGYDHDQGLFFPALKDFHIFGMPNLEDWSSSSKARELEEVFPSLEYLKLCICPKLRTLPRLPSSLKDLFIRECNGMILEGLLENVFPNSSCLSSLDIGGFDDEILCEKRLGTMLRKLACLRSLKISSCDKMKILPKELLESLPALTELRINFCEEMVSLPVEMKNLTSLESFFITGCHSLKYLPELGSRINTVMKRLSFLSCGLTSVSDCLRHLTTLEYLEIYGCSELEFLEYDFQDLTSLRSLSLSDLLQMTCLPEGLQQVAGTLESINIHACSGLTSLPQRMYKFTSLKRLYISECENLKVLPEEVLQLTTLETLSIHYCHRDLHRRYAKETGEDWHKIAHIPDLTISGTIQTITRKRSMKCKNIPCFSSSSSTN